MKNLIYLILVVLFLLLAALFGIDREVARRDYVAKTDLSSKINGCIFQINCNYYNKLLEETVYDR